MLQDNNRTQRILCLSDVHSDFAPYRVADLPDADIVLIGGDFTNHGDRNFDEMARARAWMQHLAGRYPRIYFVCGNHDFGMDNDSFATVAVSGNIAGIERRNVEHDGLSLYGASLSPCFNAPRLAEHWCRMTASRTRDYAEWETVPPVDIVLSHCPPAGICDAGGGVFNRTTGRWTPESLGSPGLLHYLKQNRPRLVVCGHIHEAAGTARIFHCANGDDTSADSSPNPRTTTLVVNCAQTPFLITLAEDQIHVESFSLPIKPL